MAAEGSWERLKEVLATTNGELSVVDQKPPPEPFRDPIPASQLQKLESHDRWFWDGYLAKNGITLLSALWKAGKSTLLSHLLRSFEDGSRFCGQGTRACKVLYITEEPEDIWADRRDLVGIADHVWFQPRPFLAKPRADRWHEFLFHLKAARDLHAYDVIILDTISNLWPVRDENDNAQVQSALMPLHNLAQDIAILLVHHVRKGDGTEATASRGAGALPAFVDVILELRRFNPTDSRDRRRVLSGYSRYRDTPDELVIELAEDETSYQAQGTRSDVRERTLREILDGVLPTVPPGMTYEDIVQNWPGDTVPRKKALLDLLRLETERRTYQRSGTGHKGSPYHWWAGAAPLEASVSVPFPIGNRTETVGAEVGGEGDGDVFSPDEDGRGEP